MKYFLILALALWVYMTGWFIISLLKKRNDVADIAWGVGFVLMGDHGFRQFNDSTDKKYQFMNLSSIYLPNGSYSSYYDSSSLVNQMRIFLNTQFNQKLTLLKDSTVFIQQ